jgi:hypothetical protein
MIFIAAKISDLIYTWAVWVLIPDFSAPLQMSPKSSRQIYGAKMLSGYFRIFGNCIFGSDTKWPRYSTSVCRSR